MDDRSREIERRLEGPLLVFALLTIPAIALEYSDEGEPWETIGLVLNWSIWLAFVAEVVIMLRVVPDRGRWLRDQPLDLAIVVLTPLRPPAHAARALDGRSRAGTVGHGLARDRQRPPRSELDGGRL